MSVIQDSTDRDAIVNVMIPTVFMEDVLIDVFIMTIWIRNVTGIKYVSAMTAGLDNTVLRLRNASNRR